MAGSRAKWDETLVSVGTRQLAALGPLVDRADDEGAVSTRNRLLCAGLSALSVACYRALGGRGREAEVERAGALLSLLTKVDDQHIDALAFHGGPSRDRAGLFEKTEARLAPTLASVREARAATDEGRCHLAAELGRSLAALDEGRGRLGALLDDVALGWRVQARAVVALSSHPARVSRAEVEAVTADISGVWLRMIALVGAVPAEARRGLDEGEREAFVAWGGWVQRADALADLKKDADDGLVSSLPGHLLFSLEGDRYLEACEGADAASLYAMVARHRVDQAMLPDEAELDRLEARLSALGEVPSMLRWVHGFLAWRYEQARVIPEGSSRFSGYRPSPRLFARADLPSVEGGGPCSAR